MAGKDGGDSYEELEFGDHCCGLESSLNGCEHDQEGASSKLHALVQRGRGGHFPVEDGLHPK
jgi:hypothetical protein